MARAVAVAYSISFVCGILLLANGITPLTDPALYPLLALLSGSIGVAVALRVMGTIQPVHVVLLGMGLWVINLSSVGLGAQTLAGWFDSGVFIATTVLLGRLLLGNSLVPLREPLRQDIGT